MGEVQQHKMHVRGAGAQKSTVTMMANTLAAVAGTTDAGQLA
jgi:hypothetical protein